MTGSAALPTSSERVLVAGDAHGNRPFLRRLLERAAESGCGALWQLGDFGVWPGAGWYLDELAADVAELGVPLRFIDGNHDDHNHLGDALAHGLVGADGAVELRPGVGWWPRATTFSTHGVRVGCLGGAVSVDRAGRVPGRSWWPEEVPTAEQAAALVERSDGDLDVLLCHDAPHGAGIRIEFPLSAQLEREGAQVRALLRCVVDATRPRLVLHGHWHQRATADVTHGDRSVTHIESLGAEGEDSWVIVELPALTVHDSAKGATRPSPR